MTKTVQKGTRMDETDYQKGFQRDLNKLSNEINKNYTYFINNKLGIEGYANHCNLTFNAFINKLSNEINKNYTYFINNKLGIEGYANHCNLTFNAFIKKLKNIYPEPFLKKIYQDHYPLEEVQRAIQDKMEYLKHSRDNLELRENAFEKEVININKSFLKILMGKKA